VRHWPIATHAHVLLPRPDHLHRHIELLRNLHSFARHIRRTAPAEAAAEEAVVDVDVLRRHAGDLRNSRNQAIRALRAEPQIDAIGAHLGGAIERLHARVRKIWDTIVGIHRAGGSVERSFRVTNLARDDTWCVESGE
jgi:hypothetical protein